MKRPWGCEHCGRMEDRQLPRYCEDCEGSMCFDCTEEHDDADACPDTFSPPHGGMSIRG